MLDFLSENYIWFFVAAVVLLFALIGFIVEGKKKKNKEFKGESVQETAQNMQNTAGLEVNDIPVTETVQPQPMEQVSIEPQPVQNISEPQTIGETNTLNTPHTTSEVAPNENQNITIGEPIQMKSEPVIPTAPESFYDEPLMPESNQEKPMNFEINPNDNISNERQ